MASESSASGPRRPAAAPELQDQARSVRLPVTGSRGPVTGSNWPGTRRNEGDDVVDDRQLTVALGRFARVAAHLVEDPVAWLAAEHVTEPVTGSGTLAQLRRRGAAVGHILLGRTHPGAPGWEQVPVQERCQWWGRRITAVAVPIAAAPRVTGVLADRVPLQAALGAAAAGLAVCAVAREHGIERPEDWVPLLARVLFGRALTRPAAVPTLEEASAAAGAAGDEERPPPAGIARRV